MKYFYHCLPCFFEISSFVPVSMQCTLLTSQHVEAKKASKLYDPHALLMFLRFTKYLKKKYFIMSHCHICCCRLSRRVVYCRESESWWVVMTTWTLGLATSRSLLRFMPGPMDLLWSVLRFNNYPACPVRYYALQPGAASFRLSLNWRSE